MKVLVYTTAFILAVFTLGCNSGTTTTTEPDIPVTTSTVPINPNDSNSVRNGLQGNWTAIRPDTAKFKSKTEIHFIIGKDTGVTFMRFGKKLTKPDSDTSTVAISDSFNWRFNPSKEKGVSLISYNKKRTIVHQGAGFSGEKNAKSIMESLTPVDTVYFRLAGNDTLIIYNPKTQKTDFVLTRDKK